ncbi:protein G12-like [Anabrus simplex]|uniref:protein G12-like n=1 Tax=Anabrus simplex TaxID=316456 RepID=UPI0035A3A8E4
MKFLLVLLVAVVHGCVCASISTRNDLENDFQDFIKLVSVDKLSAIVKDHVTNDAELQDFLAYVRTDDFKNIISSLEAIPEFLQFLTYMEHSGLRAFELFNLLNEALHLPALPIPTIRVAKRSPRSINGMIDELIAALPRDELRALAQDKLLNSPSFKTFIGRIRSDEFRGNVKKLATNPEYQVISQTFRDHGIELHHVIDFVKALLGMG